MTVPARISVRVTVAGVDISALVQPGSLTVDNVLTQRVDTCSFKLESDLPLALDTWQEVHVLGDNFSFFGGHITSIEEEAGANLGIAYAIKASDFSLRLDKVLVKEEFEEKTDAEMILALFAKYVPGEGYNVSDAVTSIKQYSRKRFNRVTLLEAITDLAKTANAEFYVDAAKKLWFFERSSGTAEIPPFGFSDTPDYSSMQPYYGFSIDRDGSGVVNRVEVVGGNYRSDDTTFFLAGTGEDERISLPFRMHAADGATAVQIWRNDGTEAVPVWTALNVLVGHIDKLELANDVLYYYSEMVIEQAGNWPALANAVKIFAKYEVPLRARVRNNASIAHFGIVMDDVIVDNTITDKTVARLAGLAKLAESAMTKTAASLKTQASNYAGAQVAPIRAGMFVSVVNTTHGIHSTYLVNRVEMSVGVNGRAEFTLDLGTYSPDLVDMLLSLARAAAPKAEWRTDEVLDELMQTAEQVSLSETHDGSASQGPYYFSETPADAFVWGYGAFQ